MHHLEESDHNYKTNEKDIKDNEDDKDPRLAKWWKLPLISTRLALYLK